MTWFKNIILDIIITAAIVLLVIIQPQWLRMILLIYSSMLFVLRLVVIFNRTMISLTTQQKDATPMWVIHLLYGINTLVLLFGQFWILAVEWGGVWILSWLTDWKARTGQPG